MTHGLEHIIWLKAVAPACPYRLYRTFSLIFNFHIISHPPAVIIYPYNKLALLTSSHAFNCISRIRFLFHYRQSWLGAEWRKIDNERTNENRRKMDSKRDWKKYLFPSTISYEILRFQSFKVNEVNEELREALLSKRSTVNHSKETFAFAIYLFYQKIERVNLQMNQTILSKTIWKFSCDPLAIFLVNKQFEIPEKSIQKCKRINKQTNVVNLKTKGSDIPKKFSISRRSYGFDWNIKYQITNIRY